ncbi:MAG: sugar porter family MFS transporter [Chlamydiota bacterium]
MSKHKTRPFLIYLIACLAGLGGFLFGYDTGAISGALLFIKKDFVLSIFEQELTVAILLLGATCSAIVAGAIADIFGRKRTIIFAAVIFFVAALLMSLAPNFATLVLGRLFVGIAIGIASLAVPMYVSELSPPDIRGVCVALNQLMVTIGILSAYGVNYWFSVSQNWRLMLGISALPALILFIAMLYLPETPRWLLSKGRKDRAMDIFKKIGSSEKEIERALSKIQLRSRVKFSDYRKLFEPSIRPAVFAGVFLAILQQVTGINTVIYYAPTILSTAGQQSDTSAILATVGIGTVNVFMTLIALILIDSWGRRPLLLIGTSIMVLSLTVLGIGSAFPTTEDWLTWLYDGSLFFYIAGFAIGLGPIAWLFISEAYPQSVRGVAMSCATLANWGSNFIVSMTFLTILHHLGPSITFLLYAGVGVLTVIFVYRFIPETKGKTLEEINSFWQEEN